MNTVAYRDPDNSSLPIGQWSVYMPHKHLWGKFKVPFLSNRCLDNQFRSASFNWQWLKLWIWFTRHTSNTYDKWEWKIEHWLLKSTRHSLRSPQPPSIIACQPEIQARLRSDQSFFQEVQHNVSAIQETLIMQLIKHAQMYFVVSTWIVVLPCQRFKTNR